MRFHADRADAWTSAAMRYAKRLVQIDVADVGAIIAWAAQANLRIEVGAVEINLPAVRMHDITIFSDALPRTRHGSTDT